MAGKVKKKEYKNCIQIINEIPPGGDANQETKVPSAPKLKF